MIHFKGLSPHLAIIRFIYSLLYLNPPPFTKDILPKVRKCKSCNSLIHVERQKKFNSNTIQFVHNGGMGNREK